MSSKEAILMSKLGKKKVPSANPSSYTLEDIESMEADMAKSGDFRGIKDGVKDSGPGTIKEMRVTGGNTSLDILKANKAANMGTINTMNNSLYGSADKVGEGAVPKTKKAYSPIKDYLKKGK